MLFLYGVDAAISMMKTQSYVHLLILQYVSPPALARHVVCTPPPSINFRSVLPLYSTKLWHFWNPVSSLALIFLCHCSWFLAPWGPHAAAQYRFPDHVYHFRSTKSWHFLESVVLASVDLFNVIVPGFVRHAACTPPPSINWRCCWVFS